MPLCCSVVQMSQKVKLETFLVLKVSYAFKNKRVREDGASFGFEFERRFVSVFAQVRT